MRSRYASKDNPDVNEDMMACGIGDWSRRFLRVIDNEKDAFLCEDYYFPQKNKRRWIPKRFLNRI